MWEDLIILGRMDDEPFSVELAGISYCDGSYVIKRESSPICVAEYIVSGSGRLICDGKTFYPSEGDVYILPVGTDHFYSSSGDDPWVKIFMNINGGLANKLLSAYGIQDVIHFENVPAEPLFREAYDLAKSMEGNVTREGFAQLALIFHRIVMLLSKHERERVGHSEMRLVKEYIDRNIYAKISMAEVAAHIYRSKDYVIKAFAAVYGKTPYEYALERKIGIACDLLENTMLPISVIADKLGYSDQHYFSNLFKKRCKVTPSEYRKASLI